MKLDVRSSVNKVHPLVDRNVQVGDKCYLRTHRSIYDVIYVTRVNEIGICFDYPVLDRGTKQQRIKKQAAGWQVMEELRRYK